MGCQEACLLYNSSVCFFFSFNKSASNIPEYQNRSKSSALFSLQLRVNRLNKINISRSKAYTITFLIEIKCWMKMIKYRFQYSCYHIQSCSVPIKDKNYITMKSTWQNISVSTASQQNVSFIASLQIASLGICHTSCTYQRETQS